ncbi:MAG: TIGR02147 family protein [Chitinispirillaceae bacterium]|nr:TIGR02147 family protein [Chitinispirillaceae bacterium]
MVPFKPPKPAAGKKELVMPNVFEYTNFRYFLADYYKAKKRVNPAFSYYGFSLRAGFKSKGFLYTVIHGNKNLSKSSILKVANAIGLKKNEMDYFENLVFFNQAIDLIERTYFCEKLNTAKFRDRNVAVVQQTRKDQYAFYSTWYHSAVRSLIDMYPFADDYEWLSKSVVPQITVKQARKSVELLRNLGMIERGGDGYYHLTNKNITTGNEIVALAALNFHKEAAHLVEHALDTLPKERRNITALTLGVSEQTYMRICDEIKDFRSRIINLVQDDQEADQAYQLNFHFFPITNAERK